MSSTWPVVQIRRSTPGFEVRNRETLGFPSWAWNGPLHSISTRLGPLAEAWVTWVADLSEPANALARLRAMHSGWSTTVAPGIPSPSGLPPVHRRSYTCRRRAAPPCTKLPWPTDAELASGPLEVFCPCPSGSSTSSPSEGLQSIGGLCTS